MSHRMTIVTEIGLYFVVAKKNSFQSLSLFISVHKTAFIPKRKWKCVRIKTKQKVSDAEMSWKN